MKPVVLEPDGVYLDLPVPTDTDAVLEYCQDPVFERFLTTPWPYRREHAVGFLEGLVPSGWATGTEFTWALRDGPGLPLLGVVGVRIDGTAGIVGYWLGAPHRGQGRMPSALAAVADWAFVDLGLTELRWEAVVGNDASLEVARKCGFTYVGVEPSEATFRDGSHPETWHAALRRDDPRTMKPGWPS